MYKYVDYFDRYGRIMQFNKNRLEPVHRWYSFVEGYSKDFCGYPFSSASKSPGLWDISLDRIAP